MLAIVLTIFNGCQKEENVLNEELKQGDFKPDVYGEKGFLVFKDSKVFGNILEQLSNMTEADRRNWEKKNYFVSQQTIFNDIVDAELQLDDNYLKMTNEELKNVITPVKHSEIYYKYLNSGIIKEFQIEDGTQIYDYSTCAPYFASILNRDGIFVICDTMYQFARNVSKQWINCDIDNEKILLNAEESLEGITVSYDLKSSTVNYGNWEYDSGNDRRIRIGINFNSFQYYADGTVWNYTHWVEVQSQKKNFWGNWVYNTTTMYITGIWDYSITYGNQYYPEGEFQNTTGYYDYPNPRVVSASNYKSSCSISTGNIYPFNSTIACPITYH